VTAIYRFLGAQQVLVYIVLLIGGLFGLRWLWRAWEEWRQGRYILEKEFALKRMGQASALLTLIVVLFCAEVSIVVFMLPGLPASVLIPTATLDMFSTPTGTISAELATSIALTPRAAATAVGQEGCIADQVNIVTPKAGGQIQGTVDIVGTVNIPDFGFYKYEVSPAGAESWSTISAGRDKVIGGSLGQWDTKTLTPGDYRLRLVVTDNQGKPLPPCIIPVTIVPQT
jgi:hypothetical protein